MGKYFVRLWLACSLSIMPFKIWAQTDSRNRNSKQTATSQVKDIDRAKHIEEAVYTLRKIHEGGRQTGLPSDFHYSIHQWTQQDVTDFAKCDKTFDFFETLLGIANTTIEKDRSGQETKNAIEAQNALTYLKPDCCKSWKGFCNLIANASDATEELRAQYHKEIRVTKQGAK